MKALLLKALAIVVSAVASAQDPDEFRRVHTPVIDSRPNVVLPARVPAPEGQLTLFADFSTRGERGVPLYVVNRSSRVVRFDAQDGDIYLKLEWQRPDGRWERAQPHFSSWCGNSYHSMELSPGQHL